MTTLSLGAKNTTTEEILRKYLSPSIAGKGADALIAALAVGDRYKAEQAEAAFDQLFKSTAIGKYLDRRASDDGASRPTSIGISDEIFRKLVIKTTARKLVIQVILEALEAYYGSEATRAFATTAEAEPFGLSDGADLILEIDNKSVVVTFSASDFHSIGAATALEVSTVITQTLRKLGHSAYAVPFNDPEKGETFVRVFTGALGLAGAVRILGGRAQNSLLFPARVHESGGPSMGTTWSLTPGNSVNGIASGTVRVQWTGGPTPSLADVQIGDYVNIYGQNFATVNRGAFPVKNVAPTYFEVENLAAASQGSVSQTLPSDLIFFRPERRTIHSTGRMATASQGSAGALEVVLPATTQAVNRGLNSGAYVHAAAVSLAIVSGSRNSSGVVTIAVAEPHGLSVGNGINVDGAYASIPTGTNSTVKAAGGLNGRFRIESVPTTTTLTYRTPDFASETAFTGGTVSSARSQINAVHGPFSYDLQSGVAITAVEAVLTDPILANSSLSVIAVDDASDFPDAPGWVCFGFGTKDSLAPVKYVNRISNQHIAIEPGYIFKNQIPAGTTVTLLKQRGPWEPSTPESAGSFYVTAASSGRVAASAEVDALVAAGVQVNKTVVYPNDKGLGNEGAPTSGAAKISDKVSVWGGDSLDEEVAAARGT